MTYFRVIPRDLFNEANLLKCYGQLYIAAERACMSGDDALVIEYDGEQPFDIQQNPSDGSLTVTNVLWIVRGKVMQLSRPLNSRDEYPLYAVDPEENCYAVFDDRGNFSDEMLEYIEREEDND